MGLVYRVVNRYRWAIGGSLEAEDLIQAGALGLMRAIEKFDPERGVQFSTYGTQWVRQAVQRLIANQRRTIRTPVWALDAARRMGTPVPLDGLALDAPLRSDDPTGDTWLATLVADDDPAAGDDDEHRRKLVAEALGQLPARTKGILVARFWGGQTLAQIAEPLGISRERVRQIAELGLAELRADLGPQHS